MHFTFNKVTNSAPNQNREHEYPIHFQTLQEGRLS